MSKGYREVSVRLRLFDDEKPPMIAVDGGLWNEVFEKTHPVVRWSSNLLSTYGFLSLAAFLVPCWDGDEIDKASKLSMQDYLDKCRVGGQNALGNEANGEGSG